MAERVLAAEIQGDSDTMTPPEKSPLDEPAGDPGELAEALTAAGGQLTQTGILVGTPMYMAPELSEGSHLARPPSDIFSLGMIAYELFSGEIPFTRPPVWARWKGNETAAPSLAVKRPDLPGDLVALIDSCLRLEPALRPTAEVIAAALRGRAASSLR